jgi:hypothetical protein
MQTLNPYFFSAGMKLVVYRWYVNCYSDYAETLKVCPLMLIVLRICLGHVGDEQPTQ